MLGFVFTDFIEMLEEEHGLFFTEEVIASAGLKNGGAYTSVGYYGKQEFEKLVVNVAQKTGKSRQEIHYSFGQYLAGSLYRRFPEFYAGLSDTFTYLQKVNGWLAKTIEKLYPNKPLPQFRASVLNDRQMEFLYESDQLMSDMAEGCIAGHARLFGEHVRVLKKIEDASGQKVLFLLERSR